MNPLKNPFSPGAGSLPPELVGRDALLEQARILFGRVKRKRSEKSLLMTGLRGVGKTVLLNVMQHMAREEGYQTLFIEAHESRSLSQLLVPQLRNLLFTLDRKAGVGDKVKRGLAVLRSFIGTVQVSVKEVTFGLGVDPEKGSADTGILEIDLPNLLIAIAEAAQDRETAVAIFVDEIQYLSRDELGALIMAMHKMQQLGLPLVLVGAGLPSLPGLAGDSKSYAERLFSYPKIGALTEEDAAKAMRDPASEAGVPFEPAAIEEIIRLTQGYPYFLQEWGYQSWNQAMQSPITLDDVCEATRAVLPRLDEEFFRVRLDRLTPSESRFLRAMASFGPGSHRVSKIIDKLDSKASTLAPLRAKLIKKGMIYSPIYGELAFTVPLFEAFMMRAMPETATV
jgi:AAA ATPase domain